MNRACHVRLLVVAICLAGSTARADVVYRSHPPMRPLPTPNKRALAEGPRKFVDGKRGDDAAAGTEQAPWKTLRHALRQLQPGDTLYLRGGVYYERVALTQSGTADAPIVIGAYPGELAVIDGGLREFAEDPAGSWQPLADGAAGEYVSTKTYFDLDDRRVPRQFLPGSWEPMWGKEQERPLALGNFADSLVPLHSYRILEDLRADNEFWLANKNEMRDIGIYGGPGLWYNRATGRVHIRLAHHKLEGLGDHAYRGETDPRKLPLVVAVGFGESVVRASGVSHVRVQDLVFRGATGSPMIDLYGSEHVHLDHVTIYGGFPGLSINASQHIRVTHSAFRGLAAPWTSRAHMKYRGTASYQIILHNNQPVNEDIEIAGCECTDDHDFAFLRFCKDLRFHHNFVDNFNDDGLECGPKVRWQTLYVSQNRIGSCLMPFTQHEMDKDESPADSNAQAGLFVFRNVIDLRSGGYKSPPKESDPSGDYLHQEEHVVGDHGSPIWPVMHFYHNTFVRKMPVFRDSYLFGLATAGLKNTERDVFNNIFVQADRVPGVGFIAVQQANPLREGGNLIWGFKEGPTLKRDVFATFRASRLFLESKNQYEASWTTQDIVADPKFVAPPTDGAKHVDLRLQPDSPAVNAGLPIEQQWRDPLRELDQGKPDIGAVPLGTEAWGVGIDGRVPLFGG